MQKNFQKMNIGGGQRGGGGYQGQRGPAQAAPVSAGGASKVVINMCTIKALKNIPFYKYDVKIRLDFGSGHEKELTVEGFDDSRRACAAVMAYLARKHPHLDDKAYNRAAALYSLQEFKAQEYTFNSSEVPELEKNFGQAKVTVALKPADDFQTSTNDLKSCLNSVAGYQPNLLEAINILVEKEAFSKPEEWYSDNAIHFRLDNGDRVVQMEGGVVLKPGLKTAADVVGNDIDNLKLVLTADIKSVVHHLPWTLDRKLEELRKAGCYNPMDALLGVSVVPTYGEKRVPFTIQAINANKKLTEKIEDQTVNNVVYFKQRYNIQLRKLELPMIGKKSRDRMIWYPAEVLQILPNQSVSKERMLPAHHDKVVRYSAMLPDVRLKLTLEYMKMLGLFNSKNLKDFQLELQPQFLELPCVILSDARVNDRLPRFNTTVDMKGQQYHRPPTLPAWAVINYNCDKGIATDFRKWICQSMKEKGVQFPEPNEITITSQLSAEAILKKAKESNFQFLFVLLDDRQTIHDAFKYFEQKTQIVTQIVKTSVVRKAIDKHQSVTIDNILLKTCLKNGGIPWGVETSQGSLRIRTNDTMYMGIEFSHQQSTGGASKRFMKIPSRVGYAATCSFHPNAVIGDYKYVEPHDNEKAFDTIAEIVKHCRDNFIACRSKPNNKVFPKNIVLYLSGYAEGQWKTLEKVFVQKVRQAVENSKLILILESKNTMERFYKPEMLRGPGRGNAREDNVPAGTTIDHTILNPAYPGFYLNPHVVLQGTARTAKYVVLVNDANIDLRSIESATHALSFLHSVCMTPTSEPAVLTIADRCALRGQLVLKYHMKYANLEEITVAQANEELTNPLNGRCHKYRYNA